jgi:acyl-CoA reductase-like NAD-dependent aldehyde dehydrogenase
MRGDRANTGAIGTTSVTSAQITPAPVQSMQTALPFGGTYNSGIGTGLGYCGLGAFNHQRAIFAKPFRAQPMTCAPFTLRLTG